MSLRHSECRRACGVAKYVRSVEDSKVLTENPIPKVIVSASGMATGGRVIHHLKAFAPDERNTVLFTGFQAGGKTMGRPVGVTVDPRGALIVADDLSNTVWRVTPES